MGKPLSVTDTSGKSVGSKNPFRYRGYCYDEETGFYYIGSRYYNPQVGRFINADTDEILNIKYDLYDKNLYAYCDNNPVIRADSEGEFWNVVAGALIGATISAGMEMVLQLMENDGKLKEVDASSIFMAAVSGAASGALTSTAIGKIGQIIGNGVISAVATGTAEIQKNGLGTLKSKEVKINIVVSAGLGALAGGIGGSGTRVKTSAYGKVMKSTKTLKYYYKHHTYAYTTLNPYKTCLKNLRKTLRKTVTKKAAKGYTLGSIVATIGSRWRKFWER